MRKANNRESANNIYSLLYIYLGRTIGTCLIGRYALQSTDDIVRRFFGDDFPIAIRWRGARISRLSWFG